MTGSSRSVSFLSFLSFLFFSFFFFNDTATTEIYTLSLHDALPILLLAGLFLTGFPRHDLLETLLVLPAVGIMWTVLNIISYDDT